MSSPQKNLNLMRLRSLVYEYDTDGHLIKFSVYDDDGDYIFKLEDIFEKCLIVPSFASFCTKKS